MSSFAQALLLVRPQHFAYNPENSDNTFGQALAPADLAQQVEQEWLRVVSGLVSLGLTLHLLDDLSSSPDAVFPNNWFSTHADGSLVLYPMKAPSRRREVRSDLVAQLQSWGYRLERVLDWQAEAERGRFLEGTGCLVLNAATRRAYVARSERSHLGLLAAWGHALNYQIQAFEPIALPGADGTPHPIYHTNVLMAVGQGFVLWCPEAMPHPQERQALMRCFAEDSLEPLALSLAQVQAFAGNMLQVRTPDGPCLLMSQRAADSLTSTQIQALERHTALKAFAIPWIETVGGGSLRCLLAEILLPAA